MATELIMAKNIKMYWGDTTEASNLIDCAQSLRWRADGQVKSIVCFGEELEKVVGTTIKIEFEVEMVGPPPWQVHDIVYIKIKKFDGTNWVDFLVLPACMVATVEMSLTTTDELKSTSMLQPAA